MKFELSVVDSIARVDPAAWDTCAQDAPFLTHAFFSALERSGAVSRERRVVPRYLLVRDPQGLLLACTPTMLKVGLLTEYGPEHLWLKTGFEQGAFSWPKFQAGVPLYPIRSRKLLIRPGAPEEALTAVLLDALKRLANERYRSKVLNILQVDDASARALERDGWLLSHETHGFWSNPGHTRFEDYVASLPHRKRHRLNKERRKVASLGLTVRTLTGDEISPSMLRRYYAGHRAVCLRHGNRPWLPIGMYQALVDAMPQSVRLIGAFDGEEFVAGIFCLIDSHTLYLRTWSALSELPELCFELVCYAPIEYAIAHRLGRIDSGLTGAHKAHRGYTEEPVYTAHWFFDDRLRELARTQLSALGRGTGTTPAVEPDR